MKAVCKYWRETVSDLKLKQLSKSTFYPGSEIFSVNFCVFMIIKGGEGGTKQQ